MSSKYDVDKYRKKIMEKASKSFVDPDMFALPQIPDGGSVKYRVFVLPELSKGDVCKDGISTHSMDNYCLPRGIHWINSRPYTCPRIYDGTDCPICSHGFDLMQVNKDKAIRREIAKIWMPNVSYLVNILFIDSKINPEDLRGVVKWYPMPKTLNDVCESVINRNKPESNEDGGLFEEEVEAYGIFFDPENAFALQIEVNNQSNYDYKKSKFISNKGVPIPIAKSNSDIKLILDQRSDLYKKIEPPKLDQLKQIARAMISGSSDIDEDDGFDNDSTMNEAKNNEPPVSASKQKVDKQKVDKPKADKPKVDKPKQKVDDFEDEDDDESNESLRRMMSQMNDDDDDED